jgi:phage shock protein A
MRDIAEDDDATLLIEELDRLEAEFRADMKAAFPNAKDEHLDGKIFDAADVMGILCDGQMMLGDVIARVFDLANGSAQPIERTAGRKIGKQTPVSATAHKTANTLSTTLNNSINMKEQFPAVFALLGVEEMQMQEGGAFVNTDLLATLNAAIEAKNQENADAQALVQSLTQEKENLTQQVADLKSQVETLNAEHSKAIEDLNAAHATAIEEKDNQISALTQEKADLQTKVDENATSMENLNTELTTAKESLTTAQNTLAERDQQINDLNAQIEELTQEPGEGAQAGSPANNGAGVDGLHQASGAPQWDPTLSATENKQRMEAYEAELKKHMR